MLVVPRASVPVEVMGPPVRASPPIVLPPVTLFTVPTVVGRSAVTNARGGGGTVRYLREDATWVQPNFYFPAVSIQGFYSTSVASGGVVLGLVSPG